VAFTTPEGSFELTMMFFGLTNLLAMLKIKVVDLIFYLFIYFLFFYF